MRNLKSEKGAITILILITILFLTTFLISSYIIMSNKMQSQREVISDTKQIYESYNLNEMYEGYFDKSREGVPGKIQQVEYIESTGTQYIDTGFKPNDSTKVEIKFMYNSLNGFVYGSRTSSSSNDAHEFIINTSGSVFPQFDGQQSAVTSSYNKVGVEYTLINSQDGAYINNELIKSYNEATFSSIYSIFLFGLNQDNVLESRTFKGKLYYCKIYDGDTLVRNFIPALDENGMACLYDKVEGKYYYNAGTGTFSYGNQV